VHFGSTRGHEQSGTRPALVVSDGILNQGPGELSVVVPFTSHLRRNALHVRVDPPEGGLTQPSDAKCEDVRSCSHKRFSHKAGDVSEQTMAEVEDLLRIIMAL
jgi:mRNA interferase MazF